MKKIRKEMEEKISCETRNEVLRYHSFADEGIFFLTLMIIDHHTFLLWYNLLFKITPQTSHLCKSEGTKQ